jgi:hypothetical protein
MKPADDAKAFQDRQVLARAARLELEHLTELGLRGRLGQETNDYRVPLFMAKRGQDFDVRTRHYATDRFFHNGRIDARAKEAT